MNFVVQNKLQGTVGLQFKLTYRCKVKHWDLPFCSNKKSQNLGDDNSLELVYPKDLHGIAGCVYKGQIEGERQKCYSVLHVRLESKSHDKL